MSVVSSMMMENFDSFKVLRIPYRYGSARTCLTMDLVFACLLLNLGGDIWVSKNIGNQIRKMIHHLKQYVSSTMKTAIFSSALLTSSAAGLLATIVAIDFVEVTTFFSFFVHECFFNFESVQFCSTCNDLCMGPFRLEPTILGVMHPAPMNCYTSARRIFWPLLMVAADSFLLGCHSLNPYYFRKDQSAE